MARVREFAAIDEAMSGKMSRLAKVGMFRVWLRSSRHRKRLGEESLLFLDMIEDGRVLS